VRMGANKMATRVAILMTLVAVAVLAAADVPPRAARAQDAGDLAPLRELAERLATAFPLDPPWTTLPASAETVQLLPGELPTGLPLALPLPNGGRLLGSAVRGADGRLGSTAVVLDLPGTVDRLRAYYERELPPLGWSPAPSGVPLPGGGPAMPGGPSSITYCNSRNGLTLTLDIVPRESAASDVRATLTGSARLGACDNPPGGPRPTGGQAAPRTLVPADRLIPGFPLSAPAGVRIFPGSGGGSSRRADARAELETGLSAAELVDQLGPQLEPLGWRREAGGAGGPLAWHLWQGPRVETSGGAGSWGALLYVVESPRPNRRLLRLEQQYVRESHPEPPLDAYGPPAAPQDSAAEAALRALAERLVLLPPRLPSDSRDAQPLTWLPKRLPDDAPPELPLLAGSRLLGSVVRPRAARPASLEIVLLGTGSPDEVVARYRDELEGQGWTVIPGRPPRHLGFLDTPATAGFASLCAGRDGVELIVGAVPATAGTSEVRVRLDRLASQPCPVGWAFVPDRPHNPGAGLYALLPPLPLPDGAARADQYGAAWGQTLQTSLSAAELEAHYTRHLVADGWSRQVSATEGPVAWSTWSGPEGRDVQGLLVAVQWPASERRLVLLELDSATNPPPGAAGGSVPMGPAGPRGPR
jgi:hypothetical protein